jgi:hypothetical protein
LAAPEIANPATHAATIAVIATIFHTLLIVTSLGSVFLILLSAAIGGT